MAKINKWVTIAAILILVLSFTMPFVPAHTALANGGITPVYVNIATGDDTWDGSSPTPLGGLVGPVKTISQGHSRVSVGGTVNVAAGTYPTHIVFLKSLTLAGAGAASTLIDGGGGGNVIWVDAAGPVTITISGVTIQNGNEGGGTGGLSINGANGATVTVNDCVIKNNTGRNGGGICPYSGATLSMNRCTISGNSSPDFGLGGGYGGGGIRNEGDSTVHLTNCTISGNTASDSDDNGGYGGDIQNWGTMTLMNCTVFDNHATGSPAQGGGFYNGAGHTMTFKNTIVANNTATMGNNNGWNDGTVTSQGYNLDSEDSCGFGAGPGDKINTNPLLGPLQDNGGPTFTHALLSGSPAIDAGTSAGAPTTDQRGVTRPQPAGGLYDIGAYERIQATVTPPSPPPTPPPSFEGPRASPSLPRTLTPAQMSLQYLNVTPQQASANQPVTISTNVVNTGDDAGNLNVALKINGQVEQSRMVSVGPQGTQPVKFTVTKAQPGTYTVDIAGQKGSFIILGAGGKAGSPVSGGLIAIMIMGVLVLATVVVLMLGRRPA